METRTVIVLLALASAAAVSPGCSKQDAGAAAGPPSAAANPPATGTSSAAPQASAPAPAAERTACAMLTVAEVSTIVGTAVAAEGDGKNACTYQPAGATMPYVKVEIARGDGEIALSSSRMLGRLEPGIAEQMKGLGDEATAIGPALWVRTGEDLVTLTLMGVDDRIEAAKRIIGLMRPRMGPSAAPRAK